MMGLTRYAKILSLSVFLIIALLVVQPVLADIPKTVPSTTDTMSIAYRGSGGFFIGNTIIFDGNNSVGNVTVLRLTGSGLPAEGVPLYDLNGAPGSGNSVEVNADGTWRFIWYTSNIKGIEKLQTLRYTVTAMDLARPENVAATSVYLRKPEFSVIAQPDTVKSGEYVQLVGNAENGISTVKIDVTDLSGNILSTYESAVSASGYFNNGFHANLPLGQYYIVITNPVTKKTSRTVLTITKPEPTAAPTVLVTQVPMITVTIPVTSSVSPAATISNSPSENPGTLAVTSTPTGATVYVDAQYVGVTPVTLTTITPGIHQIEVRSPDYQTSSFSTEIKAGETASISPVLQKNAAAWPTTALVIIGGLVVICLIVVAFLLLRKKTP